MATSIFHFGFINPIVVDRRRRIVAGHGRFEAAKLLGIRLIPVICVEHLSDAQLRAYSLADNKLAERAGWDREALAAELEELQVLLPEIGLDMTVTGFEPGEVDALQSFIIIGHGRRQLLWFAVTRHPTAEWLAQQIVEAFPWETAHPNLHDCKCISHGDRPHAGQIPGDFSNTIYAGFEVPGAGNSLTPFLENDAVLGDIDEHFAGNYLNEATILKLARDKGYSTAAIGRLAPL